MGDSLATRARVKYGEIRGRLEAPVLQTRAAVRRFLDRVDPCDDPEAEPLGLAPLLVLLVLLVWSLSF